LIHCSEMIEGENTTIDQLFVENSWLNTLSNVLSLNTLNTH